MSAGSAASARAAGLAPAARLLAAWWSRPTSSELERWESSWPAAYAASEALERGPGSVTALRAALAGSQTDALLEEYERLLVGPGRVPCPPYESLWRADQPRREQGRLMGAAAADAVRIYRDLGLQVRTDAHELPDHVTVEWEALAYAFEADAAEASSELARGHLGAWMRPFCAAVAAETRHSFYGALARLTPEWTAALAG